MNKTKTDSFIRQRRNHWRKTQKPDVRNLVWKKMQRKSSIGSHLVNIALDNTTTYSNLKFVSKFKCLGDTLTNQN